MPDPTTAGIAAAGALLSTGVGLYTSSKAAKAQEKAAEEAAWAQVRAAEIAAETTKEMYETGRKDIEPWRTAGVYALDKLTGGYDLPRPTEPVREDYMRPEKMTAAELSPSLALEYIKGLRNGKKTVPGPFRNLRLMRFDTLPASEDRQLDKLSYAQAMSDYRSTLRDYEASYRPGLLETPDLFRESPGYEFRLGEGLRALEHAAVGKKLSPSTAKAITRYGQAYASSEYDKLLDRYYRLAGLGQTAAGQMATGATTTGANLANIGLTAGQAQGLAALQAGQARASGYINQANVLTSGIGSGVDLYTLYKLGVFDKGAS